MPPTYTLDANWIGWIALVVILLEIAVVWDRFRKKKEAERANPSHEVVLLEGFPIVHVPMPVDRDDAECEAEMLKLTYEETWAELSKIYEAEVGPMPIAVIGMSNGEVHPDHPHVMWIAPRDKIFLRYQHGDDYWFAAELHNVFRFLLHGMSGIYDPRDASDAERSVKAQQWIRAAFYGEAI